MATKYSCLIRWSQEDGEFVATCAEFPGLSAFGVTRELALREWDVALRLMIETCGAENITLPEPQTVTF